MQFFYAQVTATNEMDLQKSLVKIMTDTEVQPTKQATVQCRAYYGMSNVSECSTLSSPEGCGMRHNRLDFLYVIQQANQYFIT